MAGYPSIKERIVKAVEELRGQEFQIRKVVDMVNTKADGSMRMNGTVTHTQCLKLAVGLGVIEEVRRVNGTSYWRAAA